MLKGNDCDVEKGIRRKKFDIFIFRPRKWAKLRTNLGKIGVCTKQINFAHPFLPFFHKLLCHRDLHALDIIKPVVIF